MSKDLIVPNSGLYLSDKFYEDVRHDFAVAVLKELRKCGLKVKMTRRYNLVVKHLKKSYALEFDMENCQLMKPEGAAGMIVQWAHGTLQPPHVMRLLTAESQNRLIEVERKVPKEMPGAQTLMNQAFKEREDLRRQGLDPVKEGLE